jgi:hypothetical protein
LFGIEAEGESANILYRFVLDGIPIFFGKTVQPLKKMYAYRKPVVPQSTNSRNNGNIKLALENASVFELYALQDHGLLHFGKFHINLATGLDEKIVLLLAGRQN